MTGDDDGTLALKHAAQVIAKTHHHIRRYIVILLIRFEYNIVMRPFGVRAIDGCDYGDNNNNNITTTRNRRTVGPVVSAAATVTISDTVPAAPGQRVTHLLPPPVYHFLFGRAWRTLSHTRARATHTHYGRSRDGGRGVDGRGHEDDGDNGQHCTRGPSA